ncbi:MgPa adhesin [Mycoplasmoides genitalium M2288]|nr:MgPa adhesin [Mycoplasmoides genitalium M2288]
MKSGQYQQNNTYNRLIEPESATSAATNMTNLLKLLSSKNIKQKLGKGDTQSMGNNGVSKTPSHLLFLIRGIMTIMEQLDPLKLLIQWKTQRKQLSRSIPWSTLRRWIVMGI